MPDSYFVHSNRQHHSEIDLDRLFETISVAATFSDREEWGEQLQTLDEGDRIFLYDKPSGRYLAVGTVDDPWDGATVTDPVEKVAPVSDVEEFHVGVDWANSKQPDQAYDREAVNRALGYKDSFAPSQAVFPIRRPSERDIDPPSTTPWHGESPWTAPSHESTRKC